MCVCTEVKLCDLGYTGLWPCFQKWLKEFSQVAQYSMLWVQKVSGMLAVGNIQNNLFKN